MAISTIQNRVAYAGDGAAFTFQFPYKFFNSSDLVVLLVNNATGAETDPVLDTDYSVVGAGLDAGGAVIMNVAPVAGYTLVIYRDPADIQDVAFVDNDDLPADSLNFALDYLTLLVQRVKDMASRALRLDDGFSGAFNPALPAKLFANQLLAIDQTGTKIVTVAMSGGGGGGQQSVITGSLVAPILIGPTQIPVQGVPDETIFLSGGIGADVVISADPPLEPGNNVGDRIRLYWIDAVHSLTINPGTGFDSNGAWTAVPADNSDWVGWWDGQKWSEDSRT